MPRNWSKVVPEGNAPVRHDKVGPNQPTLADLYQMIEERFGRQQKHMERHFDQQDQKSDKLMEETR